MTWDELGFLIAATSIIGIALLLFTIHWEEKQHDAETASIPADAETDEAAIQYAVRNLSCVGAGPCGAGAGGVTQWAGTHTTNQV